MTDVHDKQTRSYNMSRIKGKDTKPEMLVRRFLFPKGFRYRLHVRNLWDQFAGKLHKFHGSRKLFSEPVQIFYKFEINQNRME